MSIQNKWVRTALVAMVAIGVNTVAHAQEQLHKALQGMQGQWQGELYYLDYGSGQRYGIPMEVTMEMTPDQATLVRHITWTDPGHKVYAVSLLSVDPANGELIEAFFREGNGELKRFSVAETRFESDQNWSISYTEEGMDDDRPALIRHTTARKGCEMTTQKEVLFLDQDEAEFFLRNGTEMTCVAAE